MSSIDRKKRALRSGAGCIKEEEEEEKKEVLLDSAGTGASINSLIDWTDAGIT